MKWRSVTNDNDILRDGDQFRLWQNDQTWSSWGIVHHSAGITLQQFVRVFVRPIYHNGEPSKMVEVRRPVTEGDEQ